MTTMHEMLWPPEMPLETITQAPESIAAEVFKKDWSPRQDAAAYEWVKGYALANFDRLQAVYRGIDAKAEAIIRTVGAAAGLTTMGAIVALDEPAIIAAFLIPLLMMWRTVSLAMQAKAPRWSALPPTVKTALDYVDHYGEGAEVEFLPQWHLAAEQLAAAHEVKAQLLAEAMAVLPRAVLAFAAPVLAAIALSLFS